jgi:hypothetical protein
MSIAFIFISDHPVSCIESNPFDSSYMAFKAQICVFKTFNVATFSPNLINAIRARARTHAYTHTLSLSLSLSLTHKNPHTNRHIIFPVLMATRTILAATLFLPIIYNEGDWLNFVMKYPTTLFNCHPIRVLTIYPVYKYTIFTHID